MTVPTITDPPEVVPSRAIKPNSAFNAAVRDFLAWLAVFVPQLKTALTWIDAQVAQIALDRAASAASETEAAAAAADAEDAAAAAAASAVAAAASSGSAAGFTATSATSMTIGSGTLTFTIQASKSFQAGGGEPVIISDQAAPTANQMWGTVSSYNNGTGVMVVVVPAGQTKGSGTKAAWNVSLAGAVGGNGPTFTGGTLASPVNNAPADTLASASTVNIGGAASNYVKITGTTTITAFDSLASGAERIVEFAGALTLTHNATSLILPGAANIQTAAGDIARFISEGSGNWRMLSYARASAAPNAGWTQIGVATPSGVSSTAFAGISTTFNDLLIVCEGLAPNTVADFRLEIGDATPSYGSPISLVAGIGAAGHIVGAVLLSGVRNDYGAAEANVADAALTSPGVAAATPAGVVWRVTGGIRALRLSWNGANFFAGTVRLFGR
ncbi:MAG TPA: hypothetical protein VL358_04545 [Caulobacteraceae bacterium]|jgi:hypothetical protein|nr:hypothetical protein [Caulobacteraceae bacterium]